MSRRLILSGWPAGAPRLVLGALLGLTSAGAARGQAETEPGAVLISDLGSESWSRREEAQARILDQGLRAAPLLEQASRSENIELASRARYLLARIDPRVTECQVLRVLLGDPPQVVESAMASGVEGQNLTARADGSPESSAWSLQFRRVTQLESGPAPTAKEDHAGEPPGRIEVWIRPSGANAAGGEVQREIAYPATVCLLKRSEECLYRKLGLEIERERRAFVTLLRVRHGRKSVLERKPFPATRESALEELIEALRSQAREATGESRAVALEVLDAFHAVEVSTLEAALADPRARLAALVARGNAADLELAIDEAEAPGGLLARHGNRGTLAARAAVKLLEMGSPRGLEVLLAKLIEADPEELHLVLAALADHASRPDLPAAARARILATALSEDVLGRAPWEDAETEHFFARAIGLLDGSPGDSAGTANDPAAGSPNDPARGSPSNTAPDNLAELARAALPVIERLARGDLSPTPVRFRVAFDLWRRVARRLPAGGPADTAPAAEEAEIAMVLRLLPLLASPAALNEAIAILEERLGSGRRGDTSTLEALLALLVGNVQSGEPSLAAASFQALLRLGRLLPVAEGELRPVVKAFVEACEAAAAGTATRGTNLATGATLGPAQIRQAEDILRQWTGLAARAAPGPAGAARPAVSPPQPAGGAQPTGPASQPAGPRFDSAPWRAWLADPQRVEARVAEIGRASSAGGGGRLIYYEFDLRVDETANQPSQDAPAFQVLDGRRVALAPSETLAYEDRWGNRVRLRIQPEGQAAGRPARYRVSGRPSLFAGQPILGSIQGRTLTAAWYETSDAFFGSLPLQRAKMPGYRSLILLLREEDEPEPPPAGAGPDALWAWVIAQHVLGIPADAPSYKVNTVLQIARTLRLKESGPLLRRLFAKNPTPELARHLQEIGDASGAEFLKAELAAGRTWPAALTLAELGFHEGLSALIAEKERNRQGLRNQYHAVLVAIDGYFAHTRDLPARREEALGFLFDLLSDTAFQPRAFIIIQREVGMDFGHVAASGMDDQEKRRAAIDEAVRSAQAWWAAHRPR